jgi:hypothetical protein
MEATSLALSLTGKVNPPASFHLQLIYALNKG